jgi:hypothetical protein
VAAAEDVRRSSGPHQVRVIVTDSDTTAAATRQDARLASLIALGAQLLVAFVLYRSTLQLGFLSDAWVYLSHVRHGLWPSITTSIGYHYQPLTVTWIWLIRAVFGEIPAAFQAVNIIQVATLGFLTYKLGLRLLVGQRVGFLASLLLIGNAAYYEAAYWPLSGNCHLLSAQFYTLAVIVAVDVARGRFGRFGPWLLGTTVYAAILTHPAMITAVVLCPLVILLAAYQREPFGHAISRTMRCAWPLVMVVIAVALTRLSFAAAIAHGPPPGLDWMRIYWLVTRGIVAVFSLRGSHDVVHRLMVFKTSYLDPTSDTVHVFLVGWLVLAACLAILAWRYTSIPGVRVLILFLTVHVVGLTLGGAMTARQSHLPAVPAALLTAWCFVEGSRRLAALLGGTATGQICQTLPAIGVLVLTIAAVPDHLTAAKVTHESSTLSRTLLRVLTDLRPQRLVMVNLPSNIAERGIGAYTFSNGTFELSQSASPALLSLELLNVPLPGEPPGRIQASVITDVDVLRSHVADSSKVVVLFQSPGTFMRLTPEALDTLVGR